MIIESNNTDLKEKSLIETINIISKDNGVLKEQISALKTRLSGKLNNLVSFSFLFLSGN